MLLWWQAQINLARTMMLSLVMAKEDRDPLLLLGKKTLGKKTAVNEKKTAVNGAAQTVTVVPAGASPASSLASTSSDQFDN